VQLCRNIVVQGNRRPHSIMTLCGPHQDVKLWQDRSYWLAAGVHFEPRQFG
jgi:hypothetical protein